MPKFTQAERVYDFIASHPGCTSLEIINGCHVVNNTARISELNKRALFPIILCEKVGKLYKYRVNPIGTREA
jgi:hypothetical protein